MSVTPTPPAPKLATGFDTGSSNADAVTSVNAPTIVGMATPGASVVLYDTDGTTVLGRTNADATSGAYSIAIAGTTDNNGIPINLDDGVHSLTVTASLPGEQASGPSQPLTLTIDTHAPDAPTAPVLTPGSDTGSSALDGVTSATALTFAGQSEPGATLRLFDGAKLVGQAVVAVDGSYSVTTGTLDPGAHSFTVSATDLAGNVGKASAATSVTIDTQAPPTLPAPTLAAISDTGISHSDGVTSETTPVVVGTTEAGATVVLLDADGKVLGKAVARADGGYAIVSSTLAAGPHELTVVAIDPAGNKSAASPPLDIVIDDAPATAETTTEAATASAPSVTFTIHFDQPIADRRGISLADFSLVTTGTAYGDIESVSGSGQTGTVTVTGLGGTGAIALALAADSQITDLAGDPVVLTSTQSHQIYDVQGGDLEPVSAGPSGVVGTGQGASASASGRFVAFDSSFNNAAGIQNVYVKDMQTGGLTKVSVAGADGGAADGNSYYASLSASAGLVAFDSGADNLIPGDVGVVSGDNVYAEELTPADPASGDSVVAGAPTLVSIGNGASGSDPFVAPVVSGDGSTIAFSSSQSLVAGASGGFDNVYVYDVATQALKLITASTGQNEWDYVPAPDNYFGEIDGKAFEQVGYQPGGVGGDGDSRVTGISADGTKIAFQSDATDLGAPDITTATAAYLDGSPIRSYVYDTASDKLTVLDGAGVFGSADAPWDYTTTDPQLSADGTEVTYTVNYLNTSSAVFEENLTNGAVTQLTPSPVSGAVGDLDGQATLSKTGAYVAYFRNERDYATGGNLIEDDEIVTQSASRPVTDETSYIGDTGYSGTQLSLTGAGNAVVFTGPNAAGGTEVFEDTLGLTVGIGSVGAGDEINAKQLAAIKTAGSFTVTGHTDAPSGAEVEVQVGPHPGSPSAAVTGLVAGDGTWTLSLPAADLGADGDYLIAATVLGASAASAQVVRSFTLDTAAPDAPDAPKLDVASDTGLAHDGSITDTDTPTLTGTAEAGSTVTLIDLSGFTPGLVLGTGVADGNGVFAITASALTQGPHELAVTATDEGGNVGADSAGLALTVDTLAPDAPDAPDAPSEGDNAAVPNPNGDGSLVKATTPVISGKASPGALVKLYDTDTIAILGTDTADAKGAYSITTSALSDGLHELTVTATDPAGNVSDRSDALALTVDTLPPLSPVITILGGPLTVKAEHTFQVDVNGTAEPGSTVNLHVDDDKLSSGTATVDSEGDYTIDGIVAAGVHKLTVIATDAVGNDSQPSTVSYVTVDDDSVPAITLPPVSLPLLGVGADGYIEGATLFRGRRRQRRPRSRRAADDHGYGRQILPFRVSGRPVGVDGRNGRFHGTSASRPPGIARLRPQRHHRSQHLRRRLLYHQPDGPTRSRSRRRARVAGRGRDQRSGPDRRRQRRL